MVSFATRPLVTCFAMALLRLVMILVLVLVLVLLAAAGGGGGGTVVVVVVVSETTLVFGTTTTPPPPIIFLAVLKIAFGEDDADDIMEDDVEYDAAAAILATFLAVSNIAFGDDDDDDDGTPAILAMVLAVSSTALGDDDFDIDFVVDDDEPIIIMLGTSSFTSETASNAVSSTAAIVLFTIANAAVLLPCRIASLAACAPWSAKSPADSMTVGQ